MKMKNHIINYQEKDWLADEQEKILNDKHREISITYADLLNINEILNNSLTYITTVNDEVHIIEPKDFIELNALSIRYKKEKSTVVIALDKIISVEYCL